MNKPRNPNIDFGFHAVIPRVIRTGYKQLSPTQKYLYFCLKDLCGENGTCYRSLRSLVEETGISTGMLSESIRLLQEANLIHAEKKKRQSGGKEVWHISIVDIWQANAKVHPTKERSHSEQSNENVHTVNKDVQYMNNNSGERSHSEQERSHSETEEGSGKKDQFEEGSVRYVPPKPDVQQPNNNQPTITLQDFSPEEAQILDFFCQIEIRPTINDKVKGHCAKLVPDIHSLEDMKRLHAFTKKSLEGAKNKRVFIGNLAGAVGAWKNETFITTSAPTMKNYSDYKIDHHSDPWA